LLATALPKDGPAVVVLDELPYLIANDRGFEGTLQKLFDRELSRLPVLLIGIGSDLAMMEALNEYGRPFHQRATEVVVAPLQPADVAEILDLPAAQAIDAYLVSGGLPLVLDEWRPGATVLDHLAEVVPDPTSALLVSGERALAAEFPPESQARAVLGAIGAGERSFGLISRAAGGLPQASLQRALRLLVAKRVVEALTPLSAQPSRETRYLVADPHLRFWLAFLGPHLPEGRTCRRSSGGGVTWCWTGSGRGGRRGGAVPSSPSSARPCDGCLKAACPPGRARSAGTGRGPTTRRSTW
jgi:uncharacterized protein